VLNATQGAVLGMLYDAPKTGWELVREADAGLARFWNVTQSHVYRELGTLESRKLVKAGQPGARDRRPFTITAAGKKAFKEWLAQAPGNEQLRFPLLVTLWFGKHLDDTTLREFAAKTRVEHEQRLALYDDMTTGDPHVDPHINAVLSFGRHYERAVLAWLDELPF
jgi:DNA-binding PadR family transcriptional regulator